MRRRRGLKGITERKWRRAWVEAEGLRSRSERSRTDLLANPGLDPGRPLPQMREDLVVRDLVEPDLSPIGLGD